MGLILIYVLLPETNYCPFILAFVCQGLVSGVGVGHLIRGYTINGIKRLLDCSHRCNTKTVYFVIPRFLFVEAPTIL